MLERILQNIVASPGKQDPHQQFELRLQAQSDQKEWRPEPAEIGKPDLNIGGSKRHKISLIDRERRVSGSWKKTPKIKEIPLFLAKFLVFSSI